MPHASGIERYMLYGEAKHEVELHFLHIERIAKRSGAHEWSIKPHAHAGLHQILLVTKGGGEMRAEAGLYCFDAPVLLVVPAGIVHAFEFTPQTDGHVMTVAETLVQHSCRSDPVVNGLLRAPVCFDRLGSALTMHEIPSAFEALTREFIWSAPARIAMIEAHLIRILVGIGRIALEHGSTQLRNDSADKLLVERFRALIEQNYQSKVPLHRYADMLGITESRLTTACHRIQGEPAVKLIQRRRLLEAQRYLIYKTMSVGEIGFTLGFEDPAYFSRFFAKWTGETPSDYRARRSQPSSPVA